MSKRAFFILCIGLLLVLSVVSCRSDADVVSENLSKAADQFEINRRVVFYNGITDAYMLVVEGRCSLGNSDTPDERTVTCWTGMDEDDKKVYKKHFLGRSDNVTYFVEQLDPSPASEFRYRVIWKPTTILPDVDLSVP